MLVKARKYEKGEVWCCDSLEKMKSMESESIDLCFTSPPFPLIRKKNYGNESDKEYVDWLVAFVVEIKRLLKTTGSLVLDLGGCWEKGDPVKSAYDLRLTLRLIDDLELYFAQDFYWYNPSRLPAPAQWVTIERVRAKDSINKLLWFSKSKQPKADNRRVLQPYSESMEEKLESGKNSTVLRPSGHKPSKHLTKRNIGSIPGNLIALANSNSADPYLVYCRENNLTPHPARFPFEIPEFFIRFLTEEGDQILDPFAGSCTTGFAAELSNRHWLCIEQEEDFVKTADGHFDRPEKQINREVIGLPRVGVYAQDYIERNAKLEGDGGQLNIDY